jgi:hypothetical protein
MATTHIPNAAQTNPHLSRGSSKTVLLIGSPESCQGCSSRPNKAGHALCDTAGTCEAAMRRSNIPSLSPLNIRCDHRGKHEGDQSVAYTLLLPSRASPAEPELGISRQLPFPILRMTGNEPPNLHDSVLVSGWGQITLTTALAVKVHSTNQSLLCRASMKQRNVHGHDMV